MSVIPLSPITELLASRLYNRQNPGLRQPLPLLPQGRGTSPSLPGHPSPVTIIPSTPSARKGHIPFLTGPSIPCYDNPFHSFRKEGAHPLPYRAIHPLLR